MAVPPVVANRRPSSRAVCYAVVSEEARQHRVQLHSAVLEVTSTLWCGAWAQLNHNSMGFPRTLACCCAVRRAAAAVSVLQLRVHAPG